MTEYCMLMFVCLCEKKNVYLALKVQNPRVIPASKVALPYN